MSGLSFKKRIIKAARLFVLRKLKFGIVDYRNINMVNGPGLLDDVIQVYKEDRFLQGIEELYNIHNIVRATGHLKGAIAEVGVYKGGTAKLIALGKGARELHLFDSFEGMIKVSGSTDRHAKGDFADSRIEDVKRYLSGFEGIYFHKGWFPETASPVLEMKISFSLVHLDVDLYQSTKDALEFFPPRMVPGGVILSHDYNSVSCPGVKKAFDEFSSRTGKTVFELGGTSQCMVVF